MRSLRQILEAMVWVAIFAFSIGGSLLVAKTLNHFPIHSRTSDFLFVLILVLAIAGNCALLGNASRFARGMTDRMFPLQKTLS
jgi:hypothetical protein